jgi:hypothetical protein
MRKKITWTFLLLNFSLINIFGISEPKLIYPVNNAIITSLDPTFSWKYSPKPGISFEVKIAEDPGFTQNVIYLRTTYLNLHFTLPYLKANKSYYWTVRAVYLQDQSKWSHEGKKDITFFKFTVDRITIGDVGYQPVILTPFFNDKIQTLQPDFRWTFQDNANALFEIMNSRLEWISPKITNITFRLQISSSNGFDKDLKTFDIKGDSMKLSLTIPYLRKGLSYYWRVKATYSDPEKNVIKESGWTILEAETNTPPSFKVSENAKGTFGFDEGVKEEIFDPMKLASVERITLGTSNCFSPAVSLDGKKLAFCSDRDDGQIEIYVKNLEERLGSGETRKTNTAKGVMNFNPFWLLNNSEVGFYSNRYNTASGWELFSTTRGTGVTIQTNRLEMDEDSRNFNLYGSCSGDGKIVFTGKVKNTNIHTLYLRDLTDNSITDLRPGMFPNIRNDDKIVFASDDDGDGNFEICIVELDGHSFFNATTFPGGNTSDYDPAFSPDGTRIAFCSTRSGNSDLWVMNSDGADLKQLTFHPMADRRPQWLDNETIVFQSNRIVNNDNKPTWNIYKINVPK